MKISFILISALLFATGDYFCSLGGEQKKLGLTLLGALIGVFGYLSFAYLSRAIALSSLVGYVNGTVVIMGVLFGVLLKKDVLSLPEFFFLGVISVGLLGLAYVQGQNG